VRWKYELVRQKKGSLKPGKKISTGVAPSKLLHPGGGGKSRKVMMGEEISIQT